MSVDFWMPQAPVERYRPYPDEDPDFWVTRPVEPFTELNMANGNAYPFLQAIGEYDDLGEWEGEKLDAIYRRLMRLRNTKGVTSLEQADEWPAENYFICGRDAEYVQDRLDRLLAIVRVAREHGFYVVYG